MTAELSGSDQRSRTRRLPRAFGPRIATGRGCRTRQPGAASPAPGDLLRGLLGSRFSGRLAGPHGPGVAFRHPRIGDFCSRFALIAPHDPPLREAAVASALRRPAGPHHCWCFAACGRTGLPEPATRPWPTFRAPTAATSGVGSNVPSGQQQEHDNPARERGDKCAIAARFGPRHPKLAPPSACHPRACPEDPVVLAC